jgi:hypothetical protein
MPIEAVAFFAGSAGLLAFTAAIAWAFGYIKGYHDACTRHEEAWKTFKQRAGLDYNRP